MKQLSISFFALMFGLLLSPLAQAHHVGPAGCGLGHQVMGSDDNQVLAATTNDTSYTQTFGISSGTSDCDDRDSTAALINYFDANKMAFSKDAARGEGETIAALAKIVGCKDSNALGSSLKQNYQSIFPKRDVSPAFMTGEVQKLLRDSHVANACGYLG